jgi:hypothetical protein
MSVGSAAGAAGALTPARARWLALTRPLRAAWARLQLRRRTAAARLGAAASALAAPAVHPVGTSQERYECRHTLGAVTVTPYAGPDPRRAADYFRDRKRNGARGRTEWVRNGVVLDVYVHPLDLRDARDARDARDRG